MAPGHEGREWESHHEVDRTIRRYFRELSELVPHLPYNSITEIVAIFLEAFAEQRTVYVFRQRRQRRQRLAPDVRYQ